MSKSTQNRFQRITVDGVKYVSDISDARVYEIGQGDYWYEVYDEKTVARVRDKLKKRAISNARRRAKHRAMTDLGLVRVKGANGGTYYE